MAVAKHTLDELQKKIDAYLSVPQVHTINGLARSCGYADPDYIKQLIGREAKHAGVLKTAISRIAEEWEQRLSTKTCTGSIFWLKAVQGWKDVADVNLNHSGSIKVNVKIAGKDLNV